MKAPPRSSSRLARWLRRTLIAAVVAAAAYVGLERATRITPPSLPPPKPELVVYEGDTARVGGNSYLTRRGALNVMQIYGTPLELGYRHARLAGPLMAQGHARMFELFETFVPSAALRALITGIVRVRYRGIDRAFPEARRTELVGEVDGYFDRLAMMPTYQRLVYLHALYDIALSFEHSPLLGCTAFVASGGATWAGGTAGHTIVGRNFDFDLDPYFDREKVVQVVFDEMKMPFLSVSWPGMTGVVTGLNASSIWVSVNGARAGDFDPSGVPVVFTTRTVLEEARSLDQALAIIARDKPMVSHMLLLADGKTGESIVVERAPGRALAIVREPETMVLANHFRTAPLRDDPKDAVVRASTSTLARGARMEELVTRHRGRIDPPLAVAILRDRAGVGDATLPLGNKNALDALAATHSVVADLTARILWVSEGPHTLGVYRRIELGPRLGDGTRAAEREAPGDLPADPLLGDGGYERLLAGARLRREAAAQHAAGHEDAAADLYRRAIALRHDDHLAWRALALLETKAGRHDAARAAWARVLALAPETPDIGREARAGTDADAGS